MVHPLSQIPVEVRTDHALRLLEAALAECAENDLRRREVLAAIEHLYSRMYQVTGIEAFRNALDLSDQKERYAAAFDALQLIQKHFWGRR